MKNIRLLGATLLASTTLLGAVQAYAASETEAANPAATQTEIRAELTASNGDNPLPPSPVDPDTPVNPDEDKPGNKPNNPEGPFGIAYQPTHFNFGKAELAESGSQEINVTQKPDAGYHVGVKDKTKATRGWTLTAKLSGDIASQPGISISLGNGTGEVKENSAATDASANLVAAPDGSVVGQATVDVSNTAQTVMVGNEGFVHSSVYDYELGDVKLKIQDAKKVEAKKYTGTVDWNLAVAEQ